MNDTGEKVESLKSEAGHWSQEEGRWGCRGISGQLAKDPRSKGDTRHSGSIVYLGVSPMSAGKVKVNHSSLHQMNHLQNC